MARPKIRLPDEHGRLKCSYCEELKHHDEFQKRGAYWQYKCDDCARIISFEHQIYKRWQAKGTVAMIQEIQEAERVLARKRELLHKLVDGYVPGGKK